MQRENDVTWNELISQILLLTEKQRKTDVTVYLKSLDECYQYNTTKLDIVKSEDEYENENDDVLGGVLDDGHPFIMID